MNNFRISDSFDKFSEERKISICPADKLSIDQKWRAPSLGVFENRVDFNPSACFESSPSGEHFYINLGVDPNVVLLDSITRLHVSFDGDIFKQSISRKDLETICNSNVVEFSNESTCGLGELLLIPLARTLYNTAIEQRYPQEEIDRLYDVYRDKISSSQQRITKKNREIWFTSTGLIFLIPTVIFTVVFIISSFSNRWGQTGYAVGYVLSAILYTVVFIFVFRSITENEPDASDIFKGIGVWCAIALVIIFLSDFITSLVTGMDCYLIFGGLQDDILSML